MNKGQQADKRLADAKEELDAAQYEIQAKSDEIFQLNTVLSPHFERCCKRTVYA